MPILLFLYIHFRKEEMDIEILESGLKRYSLEEIKEILKSDCPVLNSTDFSRMNLDNMDFSRLSMVHCCFEQASCKGTIFRSANLTGSDFTFGFLENADFSGAILTESCFLSASLNHAVFSDSISFDTDFSRENSKTMLSHCNFKNAHLNGADFSGADCTNSDFTGADLKSVCFKNCDVSYSVFWSAIYDDSTDFNNCNTHGCMDIKNFQFRDLELEQMRKRAREIALQRKNNPIRNRGIGE